MIFWLIDIYKIKWMRCWLIDICVFKMSDMFINGWWVDLRMFFLIGFVGVVIGYLFDIVKVGYFR